MDNHQVLRKRQAGELTQAILIPADDANGWHLIFTDADGNHHRYTDHSGHDRLYHDLDHATELARQLGFANVRVEERF